MIRVLNIISDTNIGGAGRVLLNYLRYTDREHFETLVAVPRGSALKAPLEEAGAAVHEVDGMADRSFHREDVKTLKALIARLDPDIVHTHGSLSGRVAARQCGKKVIYTRHSAFPVPAKLRYPPGRWVNKLVNEHYADHIIAVSPATAENLTDGGISPKKITIVMNGVAPVARKSPEERTQLRKQWGVAPEETAFGILARLEPYKGHMDLLEAAKQLDQKGCPFKLLIAGAGTCEEEICKRIKELDLSHRVSFLGFQSDVAAFLSAIDVQLNASYGTEATSLSLLEGFSMGLPTIVSDYGGNPWLIDHEDNGLIFPTRDVNALCGCMERLTDDPAVRARMGEKARERYKARYTGEIFAQNVENIYRDVLKGANHGTKKQ